MNDNEEKYESTEELPIDLKAERKEKLKAILLSKQLYLSLALCSVLVMAGIYYANSLNAIKKIGGEFTTSAITGTTLPRATGNNSFLPPSTKNEQIPGNIAQNTTVESNPATENKTSEKNKSEQAVNASPNDSDNEEKTVKSVFSLPLSTDMGADYSRGEMVFNATLGDWRTHNGIDFKGVIGDTVKAVSNGKVTAVYDDPLWGTVVEIDHNNGVVAKYCGLGKGSTLEVGKEVKMNDTIGNLSIVPCEAGESSHLHFEMTIKGVAADPLEVLGRD